MCHFGPFDKPVNNYDLLNPNSKLTQNILYLHSMETFIYHLINIASLNKDKTKITSLGPFAVVLQRILGHAETAKSRLGHPDSLNKTNYTPLYKGLKLK